MDDGLDMFSGYSFDDGLDYKNDPELDIDEARRFTVGELIERLSAFPTESRVAVFGNGEIVEVWNHQDNAKVALTGVGF